ncbi:MAG: DUF1127 domain-containing protein [Rhizobiales bacterium]|nr:DUF1127 domain-containing protein [Hyphomicrobiales bacterium]
MISAFSHGNRRRRRGFSTVLGRIGEWMRHRRDARALEGLTDDQLKDIGLSRAEIEGVVRFGPGSAGRT